MAFRHSYGSGRKRMMSSPTSVMEKQQKIVVDEKNVQRVSYVDVPNSEVCKGIPTPSEYSLENLLRANVPLQEVSCALLDTAPNDEQVKKIVDSLPNDGKQVNNENVEPLNE